jgi:ABC-type sugar transport system ATPase subunit
MPSIRLHNVVKQYDKKRADTLAVSHLNYEIEDGHFVSLLGPSGCGKSTTLNMIAGLEDVTSGQILVDDMEVQELEPSKRDLAFVFQDYALYPHMTVYDNLGFGLRMRKIDKAEIDVRVRDVAKRLDIGHLLNRKPRALSGGQRQRVALGRAIARRPAVFLFDEPLSNLDALLRDQTRTLIHELHTELGATSVYVTHDQEEAMSLSDKIVVMSKGAVEQYGTPAEVYSTPATEFVATFVGKPRMNMFTVKRTPNGSYVLPETHIDFAFPHTQLEEVRLGFRPEDCELALASAGEDADATVQLVEPLGNATNVVLNAGSHQIVVRTQGFSSLDRGDAVRLGIAPAVLHGFELDTGHRITNPVSNQGD